jgi:maltose alpha-D-glucosyltransferase/alpha-amylase
MMEERKSGDFYSEASPHPKTPGASDRDNRQWYKDAVIYELHVKAFQDGMDDGIGDFRGLMRRLDYLESIGVTALWLLPFYPSPLRDDGYDIADYRSVHPDYGSIADFRELLKEAHRRDLRVITELVLNHTSDQHPWFQRARRAPRGSRARDYYVWSDTPDGYPDARIIFKDFEVSNWTWDPVAGAYYWHRFFSHQPDLNYDNPAVRREILRILDFWLGMGVDGLRLDAVPYLYQREGTNCENLPETHAFLKELRSHIDERFPGRMILAEANQWPEEAVEYFGEGDECHMAFHFPIMPRMFMALQMEERYPLIDIFEQTPAIPETCQWAFFLRNHDELTLEMVTDEERDYMYRVYAKDPRAKVNLGIRRRLAPLLNNNRRRIELMNILLLSFPGTPVLYYGDEIGMGDNYYLGDRNGVRTPMQWSSEKNAGFSRANPQQLYLPVIIDPEYHYEAVNVENQEKNLSSLLWWTKRVIAVRRRHRAFSRGAVEFLFPENPRVLAFMRTHRGETILVVINLSRFSQAVELDLSRFAGIVPVEIFSRNPFPPIRRTPYVLTLAPHDYFWLLLGEEQGSEVREAHEIPRLQMEEGLRYPLGAAEEEALASDVFPEYFGALLDVDIRSVVIRDYGMPQWAQALLFLLDVSPVGGVPETHLLPVAASLHRNIPSEVEEARDGRIALVRTSSGEEMVLFNALYDSGFRSALLDAWARRQSMRLRDGRIVMQIADKALAAGAREKLKEGLRLHPSVSVHRTVCCGGFLDLKLYRPLEEETSPPDSEIIKYLTAKSFPHIPAYAGMIAYRSADHGAFVLGTLRRHLSSEGSAGEGFRASLDRYFEEILPLVGSMEKIPALGNKVRGWGAVPVPPFLEEIIGAAALESARDIGAIAAKLHIALSSEWKDTRFTPEPFTLHYQRALYQSMWSTARRVLGTLEREAPHMSEEAVDSARQCLMYRDRILEIFRRILDARITAYKIRIHGDFSLGHLISTGKTFSIINFDGPPGHPQGERALKRSPLRDLVQMICSLQQVAYGTLLAHPSLKRSEVSAMAPWAALWHRCLGSVFLGAYLDIVDDAPFLSLEDEGFEVLFAALALERSLQNLGDHLGGRYSERSAALYSLIDMVNALT